MRWTQAALVAVFSLASAFGGGPRPQPPVNGSRLVTHLEAIRIGNRVTLSWRQRRQTSDPQSPASPWLVARVCRNIAPLTQEASPADSTPRCTQSLAEVNPNKSGNPAVRTVSAKGNGDIRLRYVDSLPESLVGGDSRLFAFYTIELRDERGRSQGFSEPAIVSLAPVPPAKGLHSELDSRGVYLIWENEIESQPSLVEFDYRIYRREEGHSQRLAIPYLRAIVHTSEGERWSGVDTGIEWDKTYTYWVTPVTRVYSERGLLLAEISGEDSSPLELTTHNVFPPAVPERLMVLLGHVPGKKFVDLTWAPNIEKDLAGYNVYRREADGPMERLNLKPITMLSFQDSDVVAGHRYSYCVSALDVRGHESAKSGELTQVVR